MLYLGKLAISIIFMKYIIIFMYEYDSYKTPSFCGQWPFFISNIKFIHFVFCVNDATFRAW